MTPRGRQATYRCNPPIDLRPLESTSLSRGIFTPLNDNGRTRGTADEETGMTANILIVEDDADINEIISTQLSRNGHTCTQAFSGTEALMRLDPDDGPLPYDLVICDLMLPGATGEQIIDSVRGTDSSLPVIVISARTSTADRVELLKLGADDYLTKPFDLDELVARVEVQLRHRSKQHGPRMNDSRTPHEKAGGSLVFRDWALDPSSRTFSVMGSPLQLTRIEFNLLEAMMRQPKRAFSKQDLFEAAWGEPYAGDDSTVTVHVSNIRAKLKASGTDAYIKTVWGIGFKLDGSGN